MSSFTYGEKVRHRTGLHVGIVTGILHRGESLQYGVTWDDTVERWHYAIELERDAENKRIKLIGVGASFVGDAHLPPE